MNIFLDQLDRSVNSKCGDSPTLFPFIHFLLIVFVYPHSSDGTKLNCIVAQNLHSAIVRNDTFRQDSLLRFRTYDLHWCSDLLHAAFKSVATSTQKSQRRAKYHNKYYDPLRRIHSHIVFFKSHQYLNAHC